MNKEELHSFIEKQQPNICQIAAYKNNEKVYSDCWNDYKTDDCAHIMPATIWWNQHSTKHNPIIIYDLHFFHQKHPSISARVPSNPISILLLQIRS